MVMVVVVVVVVGAPSSINVKAYDEGQTDWRVYVFLWCFHFIIQKWNRRALVVVVVDLNRSSRLPTRHVDQRNLLV